VLEGNYQLEVKVEVEEGRGNCGQHGIKHGWTQKSETHSGIHPLHRMKHKNFLSSVLLNTCLPLYFETTPGPSINSHGIGWTVECEAFFSRCLLATHKSLNSKHGGPTL
jgi:hypothetical protein